MPLKDSSRPNRYEMDRIWERDSELAKDSDNPESASEKSSHLDELSIDYVSSESSLFDDKMVSTAGI